MRKPRKSRSVASAIRSCAHSSSISAAKSYNSRAGTAMLQDVDQTIRNLLLAELRGASDGLNGEASQLVVGPPSPTEETDLKKPRIRLFLHDVHENLAVRDQSFEIRRTPNEMEVGKGRRPTRRNLSYL